MLNNVICPIKKKHYLTPESSAGKKIRCPHCQATYVGYHPTDFQVAKLVPPEAPAPILPVAKLAPPEPAAPMQTTTASLPVISQAPLIRNRVGMPRQRILLIFGFLAVLATASIVGTLLAHSWLNSTPVIPPPPPPPPPIPYTPLPKEMQDIAQLLPAESNFLIYFNVKQILRSELFEKHLAQRLKDELANIGGFEEFIKVTGFNPLIDLNHIVIAGVPPRDGGFPKHSLCLATGNFDRRKIMEAFVKNKEFLHTSAQIINDKNHVYLKWVYKTQAENQDLCVVVVDSQRLIYGPKEQVDLALERADRKGEPVVGKEITDHLAGMNSTTVIYAIVPGVMENSAGLDDPGVQKMWQAFFADPASEMILKKIKHKQLDIQISSDIKVMIIQKMSDEDAAEAYIPHIHKLCNEIKSFVELHASDDPKTNSLANLGRNLTITRKGTVLTMQTHISGDTIDAAVRAAKD